MSDRRSPATIQESYAAFLQAQAQEARKRPWLAAYMLRHSAALYDRFLPLYQRLRSLPRRTRRRMHHKLATTLAGAALMLALSGAPAAVGAQEGGGEVTAVSGVINVDGTTCTLVDAITSANSADTGGCTGASAGADEIVLLPSSTHTFTVANNSGTYASNALPQITSDITIEGNGSTIERSGPVQMRLFEVASGSLTLNDLTVTGGNISDASNFMAGGGILVNSGTLTVNRSTISGNSVASPNNTAVGGGIAGTGGDISIYASTISGNDASGALGAGGGLTMFKATGSLTIANSTFSGNTASNTDSYFGGGAAVYFYDTTGTLGLESSTITDNTHTGGAEDNPGGIYSYGSGTTYLYDTIISGNTGGDLDDCSTDNLGTVSNSLIGSGNCGGTVPTALSLGALANNGGPTMTHALLSGSTDAIDVIPIVSAANGIDAVSLVSCTAYASEDQRGFLRASGTGYGGDACDIGAFEYASAAPVAITLQGLSATVEQEPQTAAAAGLLGMIFLALSSLWLRRRRSSA